MTRYSIVWPLLGLFALFWAGAAVIPQAYLFEISNALVVSMAAGVVMGYSHTVIAILRLPYKLLTGADFLLVGITLGSVAWVFQFIWRFFWRATGQPQWMITHPALAFLVFASAVGLAMHMVAKGAINGSVPRRNWLVIGGIVSATLFVSMLAVILLGPANIPNTSPTVTR